MMTPVAWNNTDIQEQMALEQALRDWRKLLYDKGRINMQQRMELAYGHRRAVEHG
jgi:hypothetical protein